jgi:uncharacterized membrane protein
VLFTIGLVAGLLAAWALLRLTAERSISSWIALVMGLASAVIFSITVLPGRDIDFSIGPTSIPLTIGLESAAITFALGAFARGERRWSNWLGLVLASGPALFWVVFVIGEIFGAPH